MSHRDNQGEGDACDWCGKAANSTVRLKRCTACRQRKYCSVACQKRDWKEGYHREACQTLQAMKRALDGATVRGPDEPFWKSFWDQATAENVRRLRHDEIGMWRVHLDGRDNLVVTDVIDDVVVGHGPRPDTSDDLLKAIYACMILPEIDHRPRRPNSITLDMKLVEHYKYLWSEMLRVPLPIWRDNAEDKEESRLCMTYPIRRWGKYAKGEVFYEPQLKLRIEWWGDVKRREFMERNWGDTHEFAADAIAVDYDTENKQPRWNWEHYESWEECLEDLEQWGENNEMKRAYWKEELYEWQLHYKSLEEMYLDQYGAKTIEECAWDYVGVPRLFTDDENADNILDSLGWKCQGYKPGRCFSMSEESVKLGQRLVHFNGHLVWEEKEPPKESMEDMFQSYVNTHLRG